MKQRNDGGFTLVEVLFSLLLISLGVLAAAPMFVYAMQINSVGGDFGEIGALAVERMEQLRGTNYLLLPAGGDLSANATGYFDDSNPGVLMRWVIRDNASPEFTKTIVLEAQTVRPGTSSGPRRSIRVTSMRAR